MVLSFLVGIGPTGTRILIISITFLFAFPFVMYAVLRIRAFFIKVLGEHELSRPDQPTPKPIKDDTWRDEL
jgi:hypothetical protein